MEPESSLPHLQAPRHLSLSWARSIQSMSPSHFSKINFNIIIFEVVSFRQVSLPKPCLNLSSPPYMLHSLPVSVFLNWWPEWYLVSSTLVQLVRLIKPVCSKETAVCGIEDYYRPTTWCPSSNLIQHWAHGCISLSFCVDRRLRLDNPPSRQSFYQLVSELGQKS